jgi:hypothetical protein
MEIGRRLAIFAEMGKRFGLGSGGGLARAQGGSRPGQLPGAAFERLAADRFEAGSGLHNLLELPAIFAVAVI